MAPQCQADRTKRRASHAEDPTTIDLASFHGRALLSTRGRDSGDGQIFVNLVDNLRLDHEYTIFGEVVRGMDVVRRVLEGDVIENARVVNRDG